MRLRPTNQWWGQCQHYQKLSHQAHFPHVGHRIIRVSDESNAGLGKKQDNVDFEKASSYSNEENDQRVANLRRETCASSEDNMKPLEDDDTERASIRGGSREI